MTLRGPEPPVGVIVAVEEESDSVLMHILTRSRGKMAGFPFWRGPIARRDVAMIRCGPGLARAEEAARILVERTGPTILISLGVAGGLDQELVHGQVVICSQVRPEGSMDALPASARLVRIANELAQDMITTAPADRPMFPIREGTVTCRERILVTAEEKDAAGKRSQAHVVDMETYAVARVAVEYELPWIAFRGVSDVLAEDLPLDFNNFVGPDGSPQKLRILLTGLNQGKVRALLRLEKKARKAAANAAEFLAHFMRAESLGSVPDY